MRFNPKRRPTPEEVLRHRRLIHREAASAWVPLRLPRRAASFPGSVGGAPPTVPVDITINAVIVSGASSPWHAVQRAPGVRNVTVNGGIIAWGRNPPPGEPPPGPQPEWLHVNPDPQLVNGSVIPPVVPNIIDIRWLNCPIKVIEKPDMQTYDPN